MWEWLKKKDRPEQPAPITDEEIAILRLHVGKHLRLHESGGSLHPDFRPHLMLETNLMVVELLCRLVDEMKQLREEVMVSRAPKYGFQIPEDYPLSSSTSSRTSPDAPFLSNPK